MPNSGGFRGGWTGLGSNCENGVAVVVPECFDGNSETIEAFAPFMHAQVAMFADRVHREALDDFGHNFAECAVLQECQKIVCPVLVMSVANFHRMFRSCFPSSCWMY